MVQSEYNCSQQELYTVARLGWNSCSQHIVKFGNFKAKYIPAYITTHLNEITAASIIHDAQARGAKSEKLRVQLTEKNKEALDIWQGFKRYIADAFPENLQKATLEEAGQKHYEKASNYDWDATEGLLTSGSVFISDYQTELEADDNMPITFPAEFNTFKTEFTTLHQNFLNSREDSAVGTQDKVVGKQRSFITNLYLCFWMVNTSSEKMKQLKNNSSSPNSSTKQAAPEQQELKASLPMPSPTYPSKMSK